MENYTKYRLKDKEELVSLLAGKDNLFIITLQLILGIVFQLLTFLTN